MEKLRVYHIPQVGANIPTIYIPVESIEEGKKVMDLLSFYDLFQLENNIKPDYSNICGLQRWDMDEQEWNDWYLETENSYFDNIDGYLEHNEKLQEFNKALFSQLHRDF